MRYSTYNAIPQYPKSKKHPYENLANRRFFCVLSLVFAILMIAVLQWFWGQKNGGDMSENSRRNRQIPNPSLTGKLPHFAVSIGAVVGCS